jgi:hypothetical protein
MGYVGVNDRMTDRQDNPSSSPSSAACHPLNLSSPTPLSNDENRSLDCWEAAEDAIGVEIISIACYGIT